MVSRTAKIVTYEKKRGWGYRIIYNEQGSESDLETYTTRSLAEQAATDALAKLALR
jgi:hypothetical protein